MGPIPHSFYNPGFKFQLDAHIFITGRWKTRFHIHIFLEIDRDHLIIFSLYGAQVEGWVKDMWL